MITIFIFSQDVVFGEAVLCARLYNPTHIDTNEAAELIQSIQPIILIVFRQSGIVLCPSIFSSPPFHNQFVNGPQLHMEILLYRSVGEQGSLGVPRPAKPKNTFCPTLLGQLHHLVRDKLGLTLLPNQTGLPALPPQPETPPEERDRQNRGVKTTGKQKKYDNVCPFVLEFQ